MIIKINQNISIHSDNNLEVNRAVSYFKKEPETIAGMDSFEADSSFFDIGANIGQYLLYAAIEKEFKDYSFKPYYKNFTRRTFKEPEKRYFL